MLQSTKNDSIFADPGSRDAVAQQRSSGAPQPRNEIRDGHTRQNITGYGAKENQHHGKSALTIIEQI